MHILIKTHLIVDVHASVQQHFHHREVSVPRGQMQRSVFLGVTAEQVGVGDEQQLDYLQSAVQCSQVQWSLKLVVPHGGVCQLLQQQPHHLGVAILGGTVQRCLIVIILLGSDERMRSSMGKWKHMHSQERT